MDYALIKGILTLVLGPLFLRRVIRKKYAASVSYGRLLLIVLLGRVIGVVGKEATLWMFGEDYSFLVSLVLILSLLTLFAICFKGLIRFNDGNRISSSQAAYLVLMYLVFGVIVWIAIFIVQGITNSLMLV